MNEGQLSALLRKLDEILAQQRETNEKLARLSAEEGRAEHAPSEAVRAAPKRKRASRAKAKGAD